MLEHSGTSHVCVYVNINFHKNVYYPYLIAKVKRKGNS